MRRVGNLMERICHRDNLYEAYLRARRGKRANDEVLRFGDCLDEELDRLAAELLGDAYTVGPYYRFTVFDPKKRIICAAPFRDRVAMHALMRICHPVFDNYQISGSYASRKGKGTYAALERVSGNVGRYTWFAKLDVRHYFDSIHHETLLGQLHSLFKDSLLLRCFGRIIRGYEASEGRGLPIGNLTSQYFANHYLAPADHYLKERCQAPFLVRYMDDVLLLHDDKRRLLELAAAYTEFATVNLRLQMHEPIVNRCRFGIPFLGYVVFPHRRTLSGRSRRRFRDKVARLTAWYEDGGLPEADYQQRLTALFAFTGHADTRPLRQGVICQTGILP